MSEYLPLTEQLAIERSRLEAQQRGAGLRAEDQTRYWHTWATHPLTAQEALSIADDEDKAFLSVDESTALLSQQEAEDADWFVGFTEDV